MKSRLITALILGAILAPATVYADLELVSIGASTAEAVKKFDGMRRHDILFRFDSDEPLTKLLSPASLDLRVGSVARQGDSATFVSLGPTYRWHFGRRSNQSRWFAEFGSHPTYFSSSKFGDKDLGGHFQFTSHVGLGVDLGRNRATRLTLRYHHTSNAGLDSINPGVDMLGLTISYQFAKLPETLSADTEKDVQNIDSR